MATDPEPTSKPAQTPRRRGFGYHVARVGELVLARAGAALQPLDLTPLAYETMLSILEGEGMSQKELSERLAMYAPKMVGLLDRLEERGLVERKVSPTDRRRHMLLLTPKGDDLLRRAALLAAALEEELFGSLPEADKARFVTLAERLEETDKTHAAD